MTQKHLLQQTIENPYQQYHIPNSEKTIMYLPMFVGGDYLEGWEICDKNNRCKYYTNPNKVLEELQNVTTR